MRIATFSLPPDAVALEQALRDVPEMEIEAERIAAHSTRWVMPCLWVANAEFDAVDDALADDPTVDDIVETTEFPDEKYYQLKWSDTVQHRIDTYVDMEGSILNASADSDGWRVRIRFATRDQFDAFRDHLTDRGYLFQLRELTKPGTPRQSFGELTPDQRHALVTAMEHGYYEVPREITARELAEKLDTSHQAVSTLLRRGTGNLINTLLTTGDSGDQ